MCMGTGEAQHARTYTTPSSTFIWHYSSCDCSPRIGSGTPSCSTTPPAVIAHGQCNRGLTADLLDLSSSCPPRPTVLSCMQPDPVSGLRSAEEQASWEQARAHTMDLWYAHPATTVYLCTRLPPPPLSGCDRPAYEASGWPTFERACTEQVKAWAPPEAAWRLVSDLADEEDRMNGVPLQSGLYERNWPMGPDAFDDVVRECHFTEDAIAATFDDQNLVRALYRRLSICQLGVLSTLNFHEEHRRALCINGAVSSPSPTSCSPALPHSLPTCPRHSRIICLTATSRPLCTLLLSLCTLLLNLCTLLLGGPQGRLSRLLNYCAKLEVLDLRGVGLNCKLLGGVFASLGAGSLPVLLTLDLSGNAIHDSGVGALARRLDYRDPMNGRQLMARLTTLKLHEMIYAIPNT